MFYISSCDRDLTLSSVQNSFYVDGNNLSISSDLNYKYNYFKNIIKLVG